MAIAAFVVSVMALIASIWAAWYSREMSTAAQRQAVATEAQAEYSRRLLEIEEQRAGQADLERVQVNAAPESGSSIKPASPWFVSSSGKQAFTLTNGSPLPAFDVSLAFDVEPYATGDHSWSRIDEGASVKVTLLRAAGFNSKAVTVHWRDDPDGEPRRWSTSLP